MFGTRPEAIKLAPVILELRRHSDVVRTAVCVTAQHREMLDPVLTWFDIVPDYDLNLMQPDQSLAGFASRSLIAIDDVLEKARPDVVLIQGDTTTVVTAALAAFYRRIPVGHVEAGLRTGDNENPFPEEMNRRMAGVLAVHHFAPTERAAAALRAERVPEHHIHVTGNTVVDALLMTVARPVPLDFDFDPAEGRIILVTGHRRESFGAPLESICHALVDIAARHPDVRIVYPVHLNPNVRGPVQRLLAGRERIHLIPPQRYEIFAALMKRAYLILTDSGGIQEEAPVLGKPVLVLRDTTERSEAVEAGTARMVGTDRARIVAETERLLTDERAYRSMATAGSPFGDGRAAERIVNILLAAE